MSAHVFLVPLLAAAAASDICSRRIPNWLTGSAALLGMAGRLATDGIHGLILGSAGLAAGLALLAPFYLAGGMGAGDVKLMGAIGTFLGPRGVFLAFLFSAVVGGLHALLVLLVHGCLKNSLSRHGAMLRLFCYSGKILYLEPPERERRLTLRYGVSIALGTFLSIWKGVM